MFRDSRSGPTVGPKLYKYVLWCFVDVFFGITVPVGPDGVNIWTWFWSIFWDCKILVGLSLKSKCSSERNLNDVLFPYNYFLGIKVFDRVFENVFLHLKFLWQKLHFAGNTDSLGAELQWCCSFGLFWAPSSVTVFGKVQLQIRTYSFLISWWDKKTTWKSEWRRVAWGMSTMLLPVHPANLWMLKVQY